MATIKSSLILNDRMSGVLRKINSSMVTLIDSFETVQAATGQSFDISKMNQLRQACGQIDVELDEIENDYKRIASGQDKFNQKLAQGSSHANGLMSKIKGVLSAYTLIQGAGKLINLSDQLVQTEARLNLIVDPGNSVSNLEQMIYQSAQRSRASFTDTADAVAKIGLSAGNAFNNNSELILFAETLNKQFAIAGATQSEISGATQQLTQAMASGVLRGEEFNSIAEQAPGLINLIAEQMGVPKEQLRSLASDGKITADIVKNALLGAAIETDETFKTMPMTWQQVCTMMQNDAVMAFGVVSDKINGIINNNTFQSLMGDISGSFATIANIAVGVLDGLATAGAFVYNNWSVIAPLLGGIAAAVLAYKIAVAASTAVEWLSTSAKIAKAVATKASTVAIGDETIAISAASKAQWGFNAAMLSSPVFWIAFVILGVVVALIALCNQFAKAQGISTSCFGAIVGGIYVAGAALKNLGMSAANIFIGIFNAAEAVCTNIEIAFNNSIAKVQSFFYNLASTALNVVGKIAQALNSLPFVEIDYQGIYNKAGEFANKAAVAQGNIRNDYVNVSDAFNKGYNTYDAFADGWAKDAFTKGVNQYNTWKAAKGSDETKEETDLESLLNQIAGNTGTTAGNTGSTAGSAGNISDSLDKTNEELKWIRDIAERDVINRFTTAEVKVDFTGMTNQITSDVDLDGFISGFTEKFKESLQTAAQGVH